MRKWLLLLLIPVLFQEVHFAVVRLSESWKEVVVGGGSYRVVEGGKGEVHWTASGGGSGSGGDWCSLTIEQRSGELHWEAGQNHGSSWVYRSTEPGAPRFLVYQPILGYTTNHKFWENPELLQPGVWLIVPSPQGYQREAVLTNPLSLALRNPEGVAVTLVFLFCHLFG